MNIFGCSQRSWRDFENQHGGVHLYNMFISIHLFWVRDQHKGQVPTWWSFALICISRERYWSVMVTRMLVGIPRLIYSIHRMFDCYSSMEVSFSYLFLQHTLIRYHNFREELVYYILALEESFVEMWDYTYFSLLLSLSLVEENILSLTWYLLESTWQNKS